MVIFDSPDASRALGRCYALLRRWAREAGGKGTADRSGPDRSQPRRSKMTTVAQALKDPSRRQEVAGGTG